MLCALLIFDGPAFPAPLEDVSPWFDMCTRPLADVTAALAAQTHRRRRHTFTHPRATAQRPPTIYETGSRNRFHKSSAAHTESSGLPCRCACLCPAPPQPPSSRVGIPPTCTAPSAHSRSAGRARCRDRDGARCG
jgi:hypothetical protein